MKCATFNGLEFDVEKFVTMPRCQGKFYQDGAGCLLTAFMYAFGFKIEAGEDKSLDQFGNLTIFMYTKYFHPSHKNIMVFDSGLGAVIGDLAQDLGIKDSSYGYDIMSIYDTVDPVKATNMVWELIDRLPNKKVNTEKRLVEIK